MTSSVVEMIAKYLKSFKEKIDDRVPVLYCIIVITTLFWYLTFPDDAWYQSLLISHGKKPMFADSYLIQGDHNNWPTASNVSMYSVEYCDTKFTIDEKKMEGIKMRGSSWINVNTESAVSQYRDICKFQAVGADYIYESDALSVNFFSSGSPVFLLCSVVISSTLPLVIWRSTSILKNRKGEGGIIAEYGYIIVCIIWLTVTVADQSKYKIVYNNYIVVFLLFIYLYINTKVWFYTNDFSVQVITDPYSEDSSSNSMRIPEQWKKPFTREKQTLLSKRKRNLFKLNLPFKMESDREGKNSFNTFRWWRPESNRQGKNTVLEFLTEEKILAPPLSIITASCFSLMSAASIFCVGSYWMYTDIFYITAFVFISTSMCVPCTLIMFIDTESEPNKQYIEHLKAMFSFTHISMVLSTLVYVILIIETANDTQKYSNITNIVIFLISFLVYNLSHYYQMWEFSKNETENENKNQGLLTELVFFLCVPFCSMVMAIVAATK